MVSHSVSSLREQARTQQHRRLLLQIEIKDTLSMICEQCIAVVVAGGDSKQVARASS